MNNKTLAKRENRLFKLLLLCAILLFTFTAINIAQKANAKDLRMMTFNIRYGTANDGENSWQFRRENLFETIKKFNPNLLGLQEALTFQIEELLKQFPEMEMIGVGRDDGKQAGEYSCILYNKNLFKVDTTETFWFSDTPAIPNSKNWGNNYTRICTWAKFIDIKSKKKFYFYNLHLDHESQPSREKSADLLISKMNSLTEKHPIILTGDFNCGESNQTIISILNSGLVDSYRTKHQKNEEEATFNGFKEKASGEKIDFVFTSKEIKIKSAEIIKDSYNGRFPSDHFPVTAVLKL